MALKGEVSTERLKYQCPMQVKISVNNRLHYYKRLLGNGELFLFVTTAETKTGVLLIDISDTL
jgi:hypothetical protein